MKIAKNINEVPRIVPCITSNTRVIFPKMMIPLEFEKGECERLAEYLKINKKTEGGAYLVVAESFDIGSIGTLCKYLDTYSATDGKIKLLLNGYYRVTIEEDPQIDPYDFYTTTQRIAEETGVTDETSRILVTEVLSVFDKVVGLARISRDVMTTITAHRNNTGAVCDIIASTLDISVEKKYKILGALHIPTRIKLILKYLEEFLEILKVAQSIANETRQNLEEKNKEYYLRSEMSTIRKKLGEDNDKGAEVQEYEKRIEKKNLPEEALKEIKNELKRMKRMHPASHEYSVIATYMDWMLDLPWNDSTKDMLDIKKARVKLDDDHYGLEKPKKRILEYLAVRKLNPDSRSPILCMHGPPGTGKTSLGRSIAEAMGREFQRMSLGGVRDEAEIRGHRSTYVGSMPGRIIQSIKRAGTNNPVIMLDEIDKLGSDHRGDPSSALLEALDPEQNFAFSDHYLRVKFDLSKVIFITTANILETIPPALRDRMEMINFPGYSQDEKEKIAQQFLIPRQIKEHGIKSVKFTKYALDEIINGYTRESGVRNLEREIANICRGIACKYIEDGIKEKQVGRPLVRKYLGIPRFMKKDDIAITKPGLSIGMYYSAIGGGLMFYEACSMKMYGKFPTHSVSGNLKGVMKESITVAIKWIRANQAEIHVSGIDNCDIHVHIPEGATPKDGPSGGIGILVALVSLLSNKIPRGKTAYSGEITLSGKVLPVGGVKEKVLGAHRAGIKNIVLPSWSKDKLDKIPKDVKDTIKFYFVDTMTEVLDIAFKKEK